MDQKALRACFALSLLSLPSVTLASSFQLLEQSPAHMGKAFAGTASDITDASTVYFNPAGMARLDGQHLTLGGNVVLTEAEFANDGSNYVIQGNTVPVQGSGTTDETGFIPNAYWVVPVSEQFTLGLGAGGPFGLSSDFGTEWPGRYDATFSELEVTNLNLTSAWAPNDQIAFGLGINHQMIDVTLQSQFDSTLGANPDPATDSRASIEGDDDDIVFDASVLWTPAPGSQLGLTWRQGGDFTLDGSAAFELNAACAPGAGSPTGAPPAPTTGTLCAGALTGLEGAVTAGAELPDTITLSGSQQLNDVWALHADIAQTRWSSIQTIAVDNADNGENVSTLDLRYDDTLRLALGASAALTDTFTLRFGVAQDEAPQTDPEFVSPRIPDEDRTWLAVGTNFQVFESVTMDVSYAHLLVDDAQLERTEPTPLGGSYTLDGSFDNSVNILAAQVNWQF